MALKENIIIAILVGMTGETPRFTSLAIIEILMVCRERYRAPDDCSIRQDLSINYNEGQESHGIVFAPVDVITERDALILSRAGQYALQDYPGFERDLDQLKNRPFELH